MKSSDYKRKAAEMKALMKEYAAKEAEKAESRKAREEDSHRRDVEARRLYPVLEKHSINYRDPNCECQPDCVKVFL